MTFSLAVFRLDARAVPVIEIAGRHYDLTKLTPGLFGTRTQNGLLPLFDDWPRAEAVLMRLAEDPDPFAEVDTPFNPTDILAPLLYPSKVICIGGNYRDHLQAIGLPKKDGPAAPPTFFLKPPTTTIVGNGCSVQAPKGEAQLDWEIELAVTIGTTARRVSPAGALDCVAGYTVAIDLTARKHLLHSEGATGIDVFGGKAFDGSCPLGPRIVPSRFIADPQRLRLSLSVNGQVKQDSSTSMMLRSVAEQISYISEIVTLEPGDVVLTGTPSGTAYPHGPFLKSGDQIDAEIEEIGKLSARIR